MSITQTLHRAVQLNPWETATIYNERSRSYRDLHDRVARLAAALKSLGMQAGDRIGMLSLNSDRYIEYYFAVPWAGGWLNPVNVRWAPAEMIYSFNDSQTSILLVDDQFSSLVSRFRKEAPGIRHYIYAGDGDTPEGMHSYEELIEKHGPADDARIAEDDVLGIFYTGGTTGFPKGAILTHLNFLSSCQAILLETSMGQRENGVWLHLAPMFHLADGWLVVVQTMQCRPHVIKSTFDPSDTLHTIEQQGVTDVLLVPTMLQILVDAPDIKSYNLASLKGVIYGASSISEAVLERAMTALDGVEFSQAYGSTELGPITFLQPVHHLKAGRQAGLLRSCGRAGRASEIKIVDPDGKEVPRGKVGEVVVCGPSVIKKGYWNKPEETAATLRDGWLHIGDAAYMNNEGFVFIVDRIKDMIVTGGENVYSTEVEQAIARHPAVASCAAIGIADEKWGEVVHAIVVLKSGQSSTETEIRDHCREWIAGYKCPRSVEFRDELPLSGAGKILKTELRKTYRH